MCDCLCGRVVKTCNYKYMYMYIIKIGYAYKVEIVLET